MTPAARLQAVIDLLDETIKTPRPADTLASLYFRGRRYIGSSDRREINNRFYRIMRGWFRLGWYAERGGLPVDARSLTLVDALIHDGLDSARANDLFSGGRFSPPPLSSVEKKAVKALAGAALDHPDMPPAVRAECPDWAIEPMTRALGDDFERELRAMQSPAPMDLRVNTIKTTRDEVLARLKADGFEAEAGKISPLSIRVYGRPQISQYKLFTDGFFEIQDEGSQMVAVVADAKPGEQVVDFCAGAGGKTLALGAAMQNKGRIVAMDVLGGRLLRAKERFRRAGLHNIEARELTSERDKYVKRHVESFDLVLVDAPCSGTGTWRRDPDKRWRQLGPGLPALVPLQRSILDSACRMVKKGGRLVYATCSLLPEENEDQVESFLRDHPEFERARDDLRLTPARNDTDGFFASVMRKKEGGDGAK